MLIDIKKISPDDLTNIKAEFGYVFVMENHGLEALFKIIKDNSIYYFAAQQQELKMLSLDEDLYRAYVEQTLEMHS